MKKKILSIALALCLILTMMPMATGVAWADVTVSISNATYYGSGALQKIEGSFTRNTASAKSQLVLMSKRLRSAGEAETDSWYGDFTDLGYYGSKFTSFENVLDYDRGQNGGTAGIFGIIKSTNEINEVYGTNSFSFDFSESDIPLSTNALYYVYL